jgi:opacity protein-like surface antigen
MRNLCLALVVLALSLCAAAADQPRVEFFGGPSWGHLDHTGISIAGLKDNYWGWVASGNFNMNKWIGLKADISGHYGDVVPGTRANSYSFLFGPQLSIRGEHATPFAHALFGFNRVASSGASDTAFAMAFGGGLDINVSKILAVRLGQLDWLHTRHDARSLGGREFQNNIRYAGGIVLRFGQ